MFGSCWKGWSQRRVPDLANSIESLYFFFLGPVSITFLITNPPSFWSHLKFFPMISVDVLFFFGCGSFRLLLTCVDYLFIYFIFLRLGFMESMHMPGALLDLLLISVLPGGRSPPGRSRRCCLRERSLGAVGSGNQIRRRSNTSRRCSPHLLCTRRRSLRRRRRPRRCCPKAKQPPRGPTGSPPPPPQKTDGMLERHLDLHLPSRGDPVGQATTAGGSG